MIPHRSPLYSRSTAGDLEGGRLRGTPHRTFTVHVRQSGRAKCMDRRCPPADVYEDQIIAVATAQ